MPQAARAQVPEVLRIIRLVRRPSTIGGSSGPCDSRGTQNAYRKSKATIESRTRLLWLIRPLYDAPKELPAFCSDEVKLFSLCESGGIGRRTRLRKWQTRPCNLPGIINPFCLPRF